MSPTLPCPFHTCGRHHSSIPAFISSEAGRDSKSFQDSTPNRTDPGGETCLLYLKLKKCQEIFGQGVISYFSKLDKNIFQLIL